MKLAFSLLFFITTIQNCISQDIDIFSPNYPFPNHISEIEKDSMDRYRLRALNDIHKDFPGCEHIRGTLKEKYECSKLNQQKYINDHLVYPDSAWNNNIEGIVIVKFIAEKDGSIQHIELVHDIGYGCGEEALRLVSKMPHFEPGRASGMPHRNTQHVAIEFYRYEYYIRKARIDNYKN